MSTAAAPTGVTADWFALGQLSGVRRAAFQAEETCVASLQHPQWILAVLERERDGGALAVGLEDGGDHFDRDAAVENAALGLAVVLNCREKILDRQDVAAP